MMFTRKLFHLPIGFALLAHLFVANQASAATFEVTATEWGDPADISSMAWAVDQANKTPGKDIINIASGLKIDVGIATPAIPNAKAATLAHFTESVEIRGNGATLVGNPGFVTSAGDYATKDNIVRDVYDQAIQPTDIIVTKSYVFAQIGNYETDNSAIKVEIQGLNGDGLIAIAKVYGGATLTIKDGRFENIVNYSTVREGVSAILAFDGSTLNLENFELHRNFPFFSHAPSLGGDAGAVVWGGAIAGVNAYLNMQSSVISESYPMGAINWNGTANIVSSVISGSGGLFLGDGALNFINSILYLGQEGEQLTETTRVIAQGTGAKINIIASTILYDALYTEQTGCAETKSFSCLGSPLTATVGGIVDVRQSAILPINLEFNVSQQPYHAREGGSFRGDDYAFIAAAGDQGSDDVKALFGNQNLITGGLAFDLINDGVTFFNPLPGGATPAPGGVLIDGVPSAGPGESNELLSPVDGQPILTDVFGNPRVRDGKRDIGAVQAGTLPALHVVPGNGEAVLSWSRPIVPDPITGYAVYYRLADQVVFTRIEVAGADNLKTTISGLTNFKLYEFQVAAIGTGGEGSMSNPQFATPYFYGPFAAPAVTATPGFHEVELNWTEPDSGNRTLFGYIVYMRKVGADQWEMATNAVLAAGPLTWKFTRLEGGTEYEFAVKALAQNGDLSPMGTDTATPLSRAAQAPVVSATPGLRSMTLDWNVPTTVDGRNICYYVILWRPDNLGSWPADNFKFTTETQIQIDGLDPAVSYQFGVAAVVEDTPGGGCAVAISGALGFVLAAPLLEPATFEVSKVYPDGSTFPVEVAIDCDGANPLSDTSSVTPGGPATFMLQNFVPGEVTCVITENVGVAGYYPVFDNGTARSPESCIFGNISSAGVYQCTVLNRAFPASYRVEKQWTGPVASVPGTSPTADIAIECDREVIDADAVPPSNGTGWLVSRQLTGVTASTSVTVDVSSGPASCQAREISMQPHATSSAKNCSDASLAPGSSHTCTIVNYALLEPATFRVSKSYSDGSNYPVEVELSCNSGLPLGQRFTIAPGSPVNFVLTDYIPGSVRCEVTESGGPQNYVPSYDNGTVISATSCVFDTVLSGGAYSCAIMNTADNALLTILKNWVMSGEGFEEAYYDVRVDVACSTDILSVDGQPVTDPDGNMTVLLGDGESRVLEVDTLTGSASCTATETLIQSGVESSSEGCTGVLLTAGESAQCTFTNTVFFEGVPVLDRNGLALLVLLTLGIGLVAFRRMV